MNGEDMLPRELTNPIPRRGKWTAEEERYTEKIIFDFEHGTLDVPEGTTLRNLLSRVLNCDPMRITKKYTGNSSIGKRTFVPLVRTPENAIFMDMSQQDLRELRASWISKLILMEQWNNRKMNLMKAHMGLGNMYDSLGSSSAGTGLGMHHRNLATSTATGSSSGGMGNVHDELASHTGDTNPTELYTLNNNSTNNSNHNPYNSNINNISFTGIQFQELSLRMILEPYVNTGSEMDYLIKWLKTLYYVLIDRTITIADLEHSLYVGSISLPALLAIYKSRCIEINPRLQQVHHIIEIYLKRQLGVNLPVQPLPLHAGGVGGYPTLTTQQLPLPLSMRALSSTTATMPNNTTTNTTTATSAIKDAVTSNNTDGIEGEQATSREISPSSTSPALENIPTATTTAEKEKLEALRHQLGTDPALPLSTEGLLLTSSSMGSLKMLPVAPLPGLSTAHVPALSSRNHDTTTTSSTRTTTTTTTATTTTTTTTGGILSNSASTSTSSISVPDIDSTMRHQSVFAHLPDHLKAYLTEANKVGNKTATTTAVAADDNTSNNTEKHNSTITNSTTTGTTTTTNNPNNEKIEVDTHKLPTTTTNIIPKNKEKQENSIKPILNTGFSDKTPGAEARYYAELHAQAFAQQQARAIATAQAAAQALAESYRYPSTTSSGSKDRSGISTTGNHSRSTDNLTPTATFVGMNTSTSNNNMELLQQEFGRPGGVPASSATMNPSNVLSNVPDSASQYYRALMESFSTAAATTGNSAVNSGSTGGIKKATTTSGSIGGSSSTGSILPPAGMLGRPPVGASRGTKHTSPMSATATSQAQKRRKLSEYTDMYMQAMYQQQQQQGMGGYHPPGYAMYPPPPSYEQLQYMEHQMRLSSEHAVSAVSATSPTAAAGNSTGVLGSNTEQAGISQENTTTTTTAPTTSVPSSPISANSTAPATVLAPALTSAEGRTSSSTTTDSASPQLGSVVVASTEQLSDADNVSATTTTGMKNIPNSGSTVNTATAGSVTSDAASVASGNSGRSSKGNTTTASPRPNYPSTYSPHYPGMGVAAGGIPAGMPPELYAYYMQHMYNGGWPYLSGPGMNSAGLPPHVLASMQQQQQQHSTSGYGSSQAPPQGQQHPSASQYMEGMRGHYTGNPSQQSPLQAQSQQMRGPTGAAQGHMSSGLGPAGFPSYTGSSYGNATTGGGYHPTTTGGSNPTSAAVGDPSAYHLHMMSALNNNTQTQAQQRYRNTAVPGGGNNNGGNTTTSHPGAQYPGMTDPALYAFLAQQQQLAGRSGYGTGDMMNYSSLLNPSMPLHNNPHTSYSDYYANYHRNKGINSSSTNSRAMGSGSISGAGEGEDPADAAVGHSAAAEALMRLLNN